MSFAGTFGAAGAIVAAAAISSAIKESAAPSVVDVNGVLRVNDAAGKKLYGGPGQRFNELVLTGATLLQWADATITGAAADTGVLTSAVPIANQHGLPVNFGPGQGNWELSDVARLRVLVEPILASIPTGYIPPVVMPAVNVGTGALILVVKNTNPAAGLTLNIWLKYSHSIEA